MTKIKRNRIILSFIGVFLIGSSIGFSRIADLGTDPFTTFNLGLSGFFNIQFGTYMVFSNIIGLIFVYFTRRHLIGIGTVFNLLMVGYVSDFIVAIITSGMGASFSLITRLALGILSLLILAIGASLYIVAATGIAPYDALPIIIEEKSDSRISFPTARVATDIMAIIIGFLFGAKLGVITIVSGFFMGPMMDFFRNYFSLKLKHVEQELSGK